jgi:malonate transporter
MTDVAGLALPFFGMIFLGFVAAFAFVKNRGNVAEATVQGLIAGYGNVGYMGPPLALVALGPAAAVPAALVFCFDVTLVFTLTPLIMAVAGAGGQSIGRTLAGIPQKVLLHPFILATLAGVAGAALELRLPEPIERLLTVMSGSAAPCALFALGVTVASRQLKRVPGELPVLILIKLAVHPALALATLSLFGGFEEVWVQTAVLMASLPPAATVYVIAKRRRIGRGKSLLA